MDRSRTVAICLLDDKGKIVKKKELVVNWESTVEKMMEQFHGLDMMTEMAEIVAKQIRDAVTTDFVKELIK